MALAISQTAWAWGSVGHDMITRVAVRLLHEKIKGNRQCSAPFTDRQVMLGHLSNIPDTYWRSLDRSQTSLGNPTHYIDWETVTKDPSFATVSMIYDELLRQAEKGCATESSQQICPTEKGKNKKPLSQLIGSAPWRVGQFWDLMKQSMTEAGATEDRTKFELIVNEMLKHAGLMSHFVADLAMPLHSTIDYDAADAGQQGLHGYFESDAVDALPLEIWPDIANHALKTAPFKNKILSTLNNKQQPTPIEIAAALSFYSYKRIPELLKLDRQHALVPTKQPKLTGKSTVQRKAVGDVAIYYRPLLVDQMALAADTLAELWLMGWVAGQRPDLSKYQSYFFWFDPDFIPPDYASR